MKRMMRDHHLNLDRVITTIRHDIRQYNLNADIYGIRSVELAIVRVALNAVLDTLEMSGVIDTYEVLRDDCNEHIINVILYLEQDYIEIREDGVSHGDSY